MSAVPLGTREEIVLKNVISGLLILVVAVFAFVGYNSYVARRRVITDDVYGATIAAASPRSVSPAGGSSAGGRPSPAPGEPAVQQSALRSEGTPGADSLPAQPVEGEKFGTGSGRYQLYRQGDMTWRLNVETGESCILLATDEQWHKERVYRTGCRGHE